MKTLKNFLNECFIRFTRPTPKFQRIVRNIWLSLTALAGFVLTLQTQGVNFPNWMAALFNWYSMFGGAIGALVSQLAVIWTTDDGKPVNNTFVGSQKNKTLK